MFLSPTSRPPRSATVLLVFIVALPLMALVAAIFIAALRMPLRERLPKKLAITGGIGASAESQATSRPVVSSQSPPPSSNNPIPEPTIQSITPKSELPLFSASPAATPPLPPWHLALDSTTEPRPYESLAFLSFDDAFGKRGRDDLTPWFEATPAAGLRLTKVPSQFGQSGMIEGVGRLRSPWPDGAVLRLQLENFDGLKMHCWNGSAGLTLVYYDEGNRWAAYKTTRDGDVPTPKTWAVSSTDDDRCRRSGFRWGGPIELRFTGDELLLSRGDVVLLAAPFGERPSDVFFDGRATIHGIALARTKDAPPHSVERTAPYGIDDKRNPADFDWRGPNGDSRLERLADGAISLRGERQQWFAALPQTGLHEIILELADVAHGAGVFLGDEAGQPSQVLRFCRDRTSDRLAAALRRTDQPSEVDRFSLDETPAPLVASHCWVKLLHGCGNLRWWISTDGIHWAQTEPARDNVPPQVASIGLSLAADAPHSQITLKQIVLRPLAGLHAVAKCDPEAFRTLAAGAPRDRAYRLLERLLNAAEIQARPFAEQLTAIDDAALLCLDLRDHSAMELGVLSRYVRLGVWAADHERLPAWTSVRRAFHSVPICSPLQTAPDLARVIRWELVARAYQHQPQESLEFIDRLKLFHELRASSLTDWAQWLATSAVAQRLTAQPKESWRELLVEELSKDAYNAVTELKAVLDGQSWEDAARLIAGLRPRAVRGIAPALHDPSLLTSTPAAMADVLKEFPQVALALQEKFASTAKLRIAEAMRAADAATLELATIQFAALPAAADAHRWLADQALVEGRFAGAISHYERAIRLVPELESEIAPNLQLAAALDGQEKTDAIEGPSEFGDVTLSAANFESLLSELREKHANESRRAPETSLAVPQPGVYHAEMRSRFDGPAGERPQDEVAKRTNEYRLPWVDRQLAIAESNDAIYVSNRFHVAAYDWADGRRIWQSGSLKHTMQRAQDWPLVPMTPLVHGERIFVRLLYSANPILACLNKSSGAIVWTAETSERESFVSDPLLVNDQITILSLATAADQTGQLRQLTINPQTGDVLRRHDLVRLRGNWWSRRCAQLAACDDGLIAVLGGITLATDSTGDIRWLRKHLTLPAEDDPQGILQLHQPPLVHGSRLLIAQPGVRTIECLETETGRQHWQAVLPEVVGMVGIAGETLVVRTQTDLRGLDLASGTTRWRYNTPRLLGFPRCDERNVVFTQAAPVHGNGEQQVQLVWLSAADGKLITASPIEALSDPDPRLGPIVCNSKTTFLLFGRGQQDVTRDVLELRRAAASKAGAANKPPTLDKGLVIGARL